MNIEYLDSGTDAGMLIRLYPAMPETTARLISAIQGLNEFSITWLQEIAEFHSVCGCRVGLHVQATDIGIIVNGVVPSFLWALSRQSWSDIVDLLQPFTESSERRNGFQWLYGPNAIMSGRCQISMLITESPSGEW